MEKSLITRKAAAAEEQETAVPMHRQYRLELCGTRAVAFSAGRDRAGHNPNLRKRGLRRQVGRRCDGQVRHVQGRGDAGWRRRGRGEAEACGTLTQQVSADKVGAEGMRRHRRVPLTPKVPADRNEADVGRCTGVAVDPKVAVYIAK